MVYTLTQITDNKYINPYIYYIRNQENSYYTDILPVSDFEVSINCDTEFINLPDEFGRDVKKYICGQFKEINQQYTSIHIHHDMDNDFFIDKIPSKSSHSDKLIKELIDNKIINYQIKDSSKSLLIHELERLSGKKIKLIAKYIKRCENKGKDKLPVITIKLYMFFGVADYIGILGDTDKNLILKKIDSLQKSKDLSYRKYLNSGLNGKKYIPFNNLVIRFFNDDNSYQDYLLNIEFVDIFASLGPTSYSNYAKIVGHELPFKDKLTDTDKSDMLKFMSENPDLFIKYSQGDCEVSAMFNKYCDLLKNITSILNLEYDSPKLSIGSTISNIMFRDIEKKTGISKKDLSEYYLNFTAKKLKQFKGDTSILNSLIYGGRCVSNNGRLTVSDNSILIDIDLDGAYNNILNSKELKFFISKGKPEIYNLEVDNPLILKNLRNHQDILNNAVSLGEYLKLHQENFVPFGFQIIVASDTDNMDYLQDFFISKYDFQIKNINNVDNLVEKTGITKVFKNDIHLGIICYSSLQLLLNDSNEKFVRYMKKHLKVITASYYHKDNEVSDINDLDDNKWFAIPLCDLASKIQSLRKIYPKGTPENTLYKLMANTQFGVLASPFFDNSNPIISNNITDSIRVACYIVEKKLNGIKSITDGCQIDVNNIIVNRLNQNSMSMSNLVGVNYLNDRQLNQIHLKRQSLNNCTWDIVYHYDIRDKTTDKIIYKGLSDNDLETIETNDNHEVMTIYSLHDLTNKKILNKSEINDLLFHYCFDEYQNILPICFEIRKNGNPLTEGSPDTLLHEIDGKKYYLNQGEITGLVGIDIKNIYKKGVFHSSANYLLETLKGKQTIAYRSIKKRGYQKILKDNLKTREGIESPSNTFFNNILENPYTIARGDIFYKSDILTPTMYNYHRKKMNNLGYEIGCNIPQVGYIKEFSVTNFLYCNYREFKLVENEVNNLKFKYGQSFEMYFVNHDGSLNYDLMIDTISKLVCKGLNNISIKTYLSREIKLSEGDKYHPNHEKLLAIKKQILTKHLNKGETIKINDLDFDFENPLIWDNQSKYDNYLGDTDERDNHLDLDIDSDNINMDF